MGSPVPPFHVHPGHAFAGFELAGSILLARCDCGEVLDTADARFTRCPECESDGCPRCGDTGEVIDHAALEWVQNVP